MPVTKFRSIEEMPEAGKLDPASPQLLRVIARIWETASVLFPRQFPRGVRRYRSYSEMSADQERLEHEAIQEVRARRTGQRG